MTDAFATVVRLMWIDDLIEEEGQIQRSDIARAFRMSVQQASHDLRRYMQLNPRRIAYDPSPRCYIQVEGSMPLFTRGHRCAAAEIVSVVAEHYPTQEQSN
ncbi:hypothetical protein ACGYJ8_15365 [Sulfitobacter sp. 1A12126]|uniref:hypothetical protein n=1 Tax=Sulfitobacter sp. 1A12126 TaxID=3368591 RepID=UPI0037458880